MCVCVSVCVCLCVCVCVCVCVARSSSRESGLILKSRAGFKGVLEASELQVCTENQGSVGKRPCPRDSPECLGKHMRSGLRRSDGGEFFDSRVRTPDRDLGGRGEWRCLAGGRGAALM